MIKTISLRLGDISIVGRGPRWVCSISVHHISPIKVGLATLLLSNRHETLVMEPAWSWKRWVCRNKNNIWPLAAIFLRADNVSWANISRYLHPGNRSFHVLRIKCIWTFVPRARLSFHDRDQILSLRRGCYYPSSAALRNTTQYQTRHLHVRPSHRLSSFANWDYLTLMKPKPLFHINGTLLGKVS